MILIVSTCKEKLSELEFVRPLQQLVGDCVTKHYSEIAQEDIDNADKIIIAGTALKDFAYLDGDFSWIQKCEKPILGICSGLHALAKAYGIALEEFTAIGPGTVNVVKENKLASGKFNAYFLHTKTGKGEFEVLATTNEKPCLIKHPEKKHYGCTFHPEVLNEELIRNFNAGQ